jgi:hypothetical protein
MVGTSAQPEYQGASVASTTITASADVIAAPDEGYFIRLYGYSVSVNVAAVQTVTLNDGLGGDAIAVIGAAALGNSGFIPCPYDLTEETELYGTLSGGTVTMIVRPVYKVLPVKGYA